MESRPQPQNSRRLSKTSVAPTSVAPVAARMPTPKTESGSSASGSVIVDGSPSRSSTPDVAGPLLSSAAAPKYRYTREELLSLMSSPLSNIKPEICSSLRKLFDGICREASDSATLDEQASMRQAMAIRKHLNLGGEPQSNQVNVDRDVDQHIALVPQRLSFSTGCHVASSSSSSSAVGVNSPDLKRERNRRDGPRIGSGRIQVSEKHLEREARDHRSLCDREQAQDDRRHDQSGGGSGGIKVLKRDYERRRQEGGRGGRYAGGSRSGRPDPEWFTDGPVSQSDTIELRGFDQGHGSRNCSKDGGGVDAGGNASRLKSASRQSSEVGGRDSFAKEPGRNEAAGTCSSVVNESGVKGISKEKNSPLKSTPSSKQPMPEGGKDPSSGVQRARSSSSPAPSSPLQNADGELDFNAIFNIDSMPGLNDMFGMDAEQAKSGGSRFKQWFHFGSHGNSRCGESRRSSLTDEFGYINDIICGHNSPQGASSPPLPQPVYGLSVYSADKCSSETQNLLELLHKAHGDAAGCDLRSAAVQNGSAVRGVPLQSRADSADTWTSFNHAPQNSVDPNVDAKAVEAGLKAILSGSVLSNPLLLSALPSMAHLGLLTAGPPSGAKVLLAEELEAQLVPAPPSGRSESGCVAAAASSPSRPTPRIGNNSGNLSFCSLPVLPLGTKVTLLSELEAGLRGLGGVAGRAGNRQPPDGSTGSGFSASSAACRPVSSHGSGVGPAALSVNAFADRMTDLAACQKLLGLVVDPCGDQTTTDATLTIVTSPTSASMSSLEANQPKNSLASNQRDFIQRYLVQQQQLKMLNCSQAEGMVLAPSDISPHILPSDLPHPLYMASGPFVDHVPSGLVTAPASQGVNVPPLMEPSIYGHPGVGPSFNLQVDDDLSQLSGDVLAKFCGGNYPVGSHPLPDTDGQFYHSPVRGGGGGGGLTIDGHNLIQCLETMGGKQLPSHAGHLQHHPPANHAVPFHGAALHSHHQQQQAAKMMHLVVQDKFANHMKVGPAAPSPIPPHHLTLQPHMAHPPGAGATLPSTGIPILLQQPPQSPRHVPSPLMFGSQPPMNLTAPLPVHLGPMTPILSPTLSPNTLQVTQPGSSLGSPVMRVPSPQELSGLAQSILQNALIKKQLEEQKERFLKRQQERNKSPKANPSLPVAASTAFNSKSSSAASAMVMNSSVLEAGRTVPSSFLPTSVLRKMANAKMEERLAGRFAEAEKTVPLLKVVKPDDEEGAEDDEDEKESKETDQNVTAKIESQNGGVRFVPGDRSAEDNSLVNPDVALSTDPGRHSPATSAECSLDEAGLRPSAARRLVGQGLMNLNSSSSLTDVLGHQIMVESFAGPPSYPTIAGFVPSGRQIKGKKLPEHLPVGLALGLGVANSNAGHQLNALRQQQQLQQAQFLMANGNGYHGNAGASLNALHALEMAKILEQQNMGLVSPNLPPPPPPPGVAQFIPSLPAENGAFGAKQLPRMMVHPSFGVNSSASNALLLQRLGRSNLQRAAMSSVNHLNLNQLALIQAIQLQTQQQQQQQQQQRQQQMWNRGPVRPSSNVRPAGPNFLPSNQSATNLTVCPSTANVANGIDKQNGSLMVGFAKDGSGGGQSAFVARADSDSAGQRQIAEASLSAPAVTGLGYDGLVDSSRPTGVGDGSQRPEAHHRMPTIQNDRGGVTDGNLARWFGSDVFHLNMPPLLAPAGQKVMTVDEIECWQHMISKS